MLAEDPPDVVLLDLVMPGMDGIEVLERIKGDDALRHLPVIVISGVDDAESVVRCIEMGAEDFLPKPFDPVILRARVNAGLNRKLLHDLEQQRVRSVFARFVPESVVGALLDRTEGGSTIPAESLTGTVLFGDLRGFTPFAEARPVDQVIEVLNRYLGLMTDAVLDHGGTLVDYMGDGVMAAFGAPVPMDDHADLAVAGGSLDGHREAPRVQSVARDVRDRRRLPDGDRPQLRSGDVRQRRLGTAAGVRGDRRHGEHRIPDRRAHEADAARRAARRRHVHLAPLDRGARLRGRVRDPWTPFPDEGLGHRGTDGALMGDKKKKKAGDEKALKRRVHELEAQAQVDAALYRIAQAASSVTDMQEFYAAMHGIVGELMDASNFYIALYDDERQMINFPYFVDEVDTRYPGPERVGAVRRRERAGDDRLRPPDAGEPLLTRVPQGSMS